MTERSKRAVKWTLTPAMLLAMLAAMTAEGFVPWNMVTKSEAAKAHEEISSRFDLRTLRIEDKIDRLSVDLAIIKGALGVKRGDP